MRGGRGSWKSWNDYIKTSAIPASTPIRQILVPTIDTVRYTYLMKFCISFKIPILFVGPTGTGVYVFSQRVWLRNEKPYLLIDD